MKSEKITGIRSVDFKIVAKGHGVVNWNGPTSLLGNGGKTVDNHTMPKLRGYTNLSGKVKEETGYKYKKEATDINFDVETGTPLYISQNCIRHHLFREHAFDVHYVSKNTTETSKLLASIVGLIRGYVIPSTQYKRTSPLLMEDFVDQLKNGNYEQFSVAGKMDEKTGKRDSNSFYSKTTFGKTKYISYGSISIEQLQFISLDNKFDRAAMVVKEGEGEEVAKLVEAYIVSLDSTRTPKATFHKNCVRNGTIFEEGENGILFNDDAVAILIDETLRKLSELSIRQAKSYMYVDEVTVDYNDSSKMMRIKNDEGSIVSTLKGEYATYFYAKD